VLSVPFVAKIEAGIALFLGVLMPMPPILVLMLMRSLEWTSKVSLLVMDFIICALMLSKVFAVSLSQLSHTWPVHMEVWACA